MPPDQVNWIPEADWANPSQSKALHAIWQAPQFKLVCDALEELQLQPLLVGGVVRDLLLDRENKDVDLIINCSPNKLMKMGSKLSKLTSATPVPLDKERGTLRLCFSPTSEVDLVSLQGETLMEDLSRRDLRINAMAIDAQGRLTDPTGGREDLEKGVLREIRAENFAEDPLRVIRALRFAAQLGFTLEETTLHNATRAVEPGLSRVAGERINTELGKFFGHAGPQHVTLLRQMRVVETLVALETYGWPQLTEAVADRPAGMAMGLALLFGPSLKSKYRKPLFDRLKLSRKLQRYLTHFWTGGKKVRDRDSVSAEDVFELSRVTDEAFEDFACAVQLDSFPTSLSRGDREMLLREARGEGTLRWDAPPWSGGEITAAVGEEPGPWLGKALRELEKQWALGRVENINQAVAFVRGAE
jgi:tRNA nucleotidyltransferase/poly(A) polymerase